MLNFPFRQFFYFTLKCNIAVQNIVKKAIADSEQSSNIPGGSRKTSRNMKQKKTDSPLHNITSHHKH